jgi:hypothetical protein
MEPDGIQKYHIEQYFSESQYLLIPMARINSPADPWHFPRPAGCGMPISCSVWTMGIIDCRTMHSASGYGRANSRSDVPLSYDFRVAWLDQAGFVIGTPVRILVTPARLVLEVDKRTRWSSQGTLGNSSPAFYPHVHPSYGLRVGEFLRRQKMPRMTVLTEFLRVIAPRRQFLRSASARGSCSRGILKGMRYPIARPTVLMPARWLRSSPCARVERAEAAQALFTCSFNI